MYLIESNYDKATACQFQFWVTDYCNQIKKFCFSKSHLIQSDRRASHLTITFFIRPSPWHTAIRLAIACSMLRSILCIYWMFCNDKVYCAICDIRHSRKTWWISICKNKLWYVDLSLDFFHFIKWRLAYGCGGYRSLTSVKWIVELNFQVLTSRCSIRLWNNWDNVHTAKPS